MNLNGQKENAMLAVLLAMSKLHGQDLKALEAAHSLPAAALDETVCLVHTFACTLRKLDGGAYARVADGMLRVLTSGVIDRETLATLNSNAEEAGYGS